MPHISESIPPGVSGARRCRRFWGHPVAHLLAALIAVALTSGFLVKVYQVPSSSMEQTLVPGDRLLVNRLAYAGSKPKAGDIVVFDRPDDWSQRVAEPGRLRTMVGWFGDGLGFGPSNSHAMVKRIVATPGQTISCCDGDGRVVRDGVPVDESYLGSNLQFEAGELDCATSPASRRCFPPLTVPHGHYLMAGDNRAASSDGISQCRGAGALDGLQCARLVSRDDIVGAVALVILPVERWATPK